MQRKRFSFIKYRCTVCVLAAIGEIAVDFTFIALCLSHSSSCELKAIAVSNYDKLFSLLSLQITPNYLWESTDK